MLFASRNRSATSRFLTSRIAIFFLAAGVWLAGVIVEDKRLTGAAIVILFIAFVLGLVGQRQDDAAAAREESDGQEEEPLQREERL